VLPSRVVKKAMGPLGPGVAADDGDPIAMSENMARRMSSRPDVLRIPLPLIPLPPVCPRPKRVRVIDASVTGPREPNVSDNRDIRTEYPIRTGIRESGRQSHAMARIHIPDGADAGVIP